MMMMKITAWMIKIAENNLNRKCLSLLCRNHHCYHDYAAVAAFDDDDAAAFDADAAADDWHWLEKMKETFRRRRERSVFVFGLY